MYQIKGHKTSLGHLQMQLQLGHPKSQSAVCSKVV